ncbi:MAG: cytochrome c oxidase subunit 3 [Verrucomicrobiaceae bacterium]
MEIPFVVNARKDTGLFNSKVGIWLFLASEVTLFGGLFSGYLFLRLYADYPWPERTLPILPGLLNTFILIGSSVTVVFAWASLKLRQWRKFQVYMAITLLCAAAFMGLKTVEYQAKFAHQAVRILDDGPVNDFAIVEGHLHKGTVGENDELHHADASDKDAIYLNQIFFKASELTFTLTRPVHDSYLQDILEQAGSDHQITLVGNYEVKDHKKPGQTKEILADGAALSREALDAAEEAFIDGRAHDAKVRTAFLKGDWDYMRHELGNKDAGWKVVMTDEWAARQKESAADMKGHLVGAAGTVTFKVDPPVLVYFDPDAVVASSGEQIKLRDDTQIMGVLNEELSALEMAIDGIDFRFTAQRAVEEGIDPDAAIAGSWILENEKVKEIWDAHQEWLRWLKEDLAEKGDGHVPTESELYRVNWDQMVSYSNAGFEGIYDKAKAGELVKPGWFAGFAGPNHKTMHDHFPTITIPRSKVGFESTFTPKWNTYYAIYFTITGLHGLHVIGGALVLGYYLFFGRKMYESNPEWLANRVEIGGLFWHFVDLVWIFLFPILYLM